jgi:hypothetical protein
MMSVKLSHPSNRLRGHSQVIAQVVQNLFAGITLRIRNSDLRLPLTELREEIRSRRSLLRVIVAGDLLFAHLGIVSATQI